jgi:hypothetical protein
MRMGFLAQALPGSSWIHYVTAGALTWKHRPGEGEYGQGGESHARVITLSLCGLSGWFLRV